ncbi:replication initiator protein [Dipodfec virus UOA04_Rod_742]|nr:replication initiator protein [Dipodfec virus UOA04_Rod_742]
MTCFNPIKAFYPLELDAEGKRKLLFYKNRYHKCFTSAKWLYLSEQFALDDCTKDSIIGRYNELIDKYEAPYNYPIFYDFDGKECGLNINLPCGKCVGCRLDYSRMWATRSVNEAFMHNHYSNCSFVTLTFNPEMLNRRNNPNSLNKVAFRSWIKRLRKAVYSQYGATFRYMVCGEYGAKRSRPHYHMIIYGFNFPDKKVWKYNKVKGKDVIYYRSEFLENIWRPAHSSDSYGFSVIGNVNFETSAYVARYITKKVCPKHPSFLKEYKGKEVEFLLTSRKPGLGFEYLNKFYKDIFNHGYVTLPNGFKAPIPRFYYNKLEELDNDLYSIYSINKFNKMLDNLIVEDLNSTTERLKVREELKKYNLDKLTREYEFNEN